MSSPISRTPCVKILKLSLHNIACEVQTLTLTVRRLACYRDIKICDIHPTHPVSQLGNSKRDFVLVDVDGAREQFLSYEYQLTLMRVFPQ